MNVIKCSKVVDTDIKKKKKMLDIEITNVANKKGNAAFVLQ